MWNKRVGWNLPPQDNMLILIELLQKFNQSLRDFVCVCAPVTSVELFSLELVSRVLLYDWGGFGFFFLKWHEMSFCLFLELLMDTALFSQKTQNANAEHFISVHLTLISNIVQKNIETCFSSTLSLYFNWNWSHLF